MIIILKLYEVIMIDNINPMSLTSYVKMKVLKDRI